jgi:hypothetical protein
MSTNNNAFVITTVNEDGEWSALDGKIILNKTVCIQDCGSIHRMEGPTFVFCFK